jgi:hypothetical protein
MSDAKQPLPAGGERREQFALIEIEHTSVSPFTVRLLLTFFLATITAVPTVELAVAAARHTEGIAAAWSHLSRIPAEVHSHLTQAGGASLWDRTVSGNRIVLTGLSGFERALENVSVIGRSLRAPAQLVMTRWLGAGNERVYPGRDGWLFYRQDVEYVTGRGFLDPGQMKRRIAAVPAWMSPPQPDPRDAIIGFNHDLAARGITLIVMPTPVKPGVHPEMLARRYAGADGVLHSPSYRAFVEDLQGHGVRVFDPSVVLAAGRRAAPQYLAADTHWRPEAMELVAERLGNVIVNAVQLPVLTDPGYRIERLEVRNIGDIARMLDLPEEIPVFPPESVWLRRVLDADGRPWRSSRNADVLLLGDSFSNIYALESMGWGTSAGFAEQLAYVLRRPIDRIVQNDEGAFATRTMLQREPDRLHGKRVVVYQFATRELTFGDWKVLPIVLYGVGRPAPFERFSDQFPG